MSATSTTNPETTERAFTGRILFLLAGLAALGTLATNIILPAFPQIGAELHVSERDLGLTLSSFFVAFAFGQLFVGPLSDCVGRKWLMLGGLATFVVGSALCAFSNMLEFMILGRVVQALGACATSVLARAIARDLFDGEALARALALTMIAMAAAPGFSPLIGTALVTLLGWRIIFAFVATFALVLAYQYWNDISETLPTEHRVPLSISNVASTYARLAIDLRFILPALSVSLVIGGLYTFFAAAPSVLIQELGLTGLQLAIFFAATVVIVFSAGFLAPKLAHRWGQSAVGMFGIASACVGSLSMLAFSETPDLLIITATLAVFLFGMGLINPLGTAISLHPFGNQAGSASALLGFLQMGCAAIGSSIASTLPMAPSISLSAAMATGAVLALLTFLPVVIRQANGQKTTL